MEATATRPVFRWLLPLGVVAAITVIAAMTAVIRNSAGGPLPARSAAALVADLASADVGGVSGTVAESADLGLPALPTAAGGDGAADWVQLLSGSHTLRVWSAGPAMSRVALLGSLGESDIVRNGAEVWTWSSADNAASHLRLPTLDAGGSLPSAISSGLPSRLASLLPTTPQQAATEILGALDATTSVRNAGAVTVAGRSAYELVVAPRDTGSLITSIRIDIDGTEHVPLRLRVFARGYQKPAFDIGFTHVSFGRPDPAVFRFAPPPGATVTEVPGPPATRPSPAPDNATPDNATSPQPTVIGSGWTAILAVRGQVQMPFRYPTPPSGGNARRDIGGSGSSFAAILNELPRVSGNWGSGRLMKTRLLSVLITDDGRMFAGPVAPAALYAAATSPAGQLAPSDAGPTHK